MFKRYEVMFAIDPSNKLTNYVGTVVMARTPKQAIRLAYDQVRRLERIISEEYGYPVDHYVNSISQFAFLKSI